MKKIMDVIRNQYKKLDRAINNRFAVFVFIIVLYLMQFIPWHIVKNTLESVWYLLALIFILKKIIKIIKRFKKSH